MEGKARLIGATLTIVPDRIPADVRAKMLAACGGSETVLLSADVLRVSVPAIMVGGVLTRRVWAACPEASEWDDVRVIVEGGTIEPVTENFPP